MSERAMVVFTFRPREQIVLERGSQAWALKPANARRCNYIVCTRNRHFADEPAVPVAVLEEHGAAFLIGRITAVEQSPERDDRYIIRFEEFAVLDPQPVIWPGHRNPVWYVEDIRTLGIDPDKLNWQPMPAAVPVTALTSERNTETPEGLTFDQARAGWRSRIRCRQQILRLSSGVRALPMGWGGAGAVLKKASGGLPQIGRRCVMPLVGA